MYVVAVVGNVTMLAVVRVEHSLHQPMYFFLCMSAIIALVLSRHLPCRGFWPLCSCDTLPHTTVLMHTVVGCLGLADLCWGVLYIEPLPLMICLQLPPLQSPCPLPLLLGTPGCGHLGRWWQQGQQCLWDEHWIMVLTLDSMAIAASYVMIFRTMKGLATPDARHNTLGTCGSQICAILIFYVPIAVSSFIHNLATDCPFQSTPC